jgi:hypothetical protein
MIGAVTAASMAVAATVSVPATSVVGPGGDVVVPVTVSPATGMLSLQMAIAYNPAVLTPTGVYKTSYADSFALVYNVPSPGDLRISMFGVTALSGSGEVCWIVFHAVGGNGSSSSVSFTQAEINEGQISSTPSGGTVNVTSASSVISMPDDANGETGTNGGAVTARRERVLLGPGRALEPADPERDPAAGSLPGTGHLRTRRGRAQVSIFGVTPLSGRSSW